MTLTHNLNAAYCTSVTLDIPAPHCNSIPLFQTKHFVGFLTFTINMITGIRFVRHFYDYKHSLPPLRKYGKTFSQDFSSNSFWNTYRDFCEQICFSLCY